MKVTINDIAKAANVSKSTVSKVTNDDPTIPESTKAKIRTIMEQMNYIPNSRARQLAQKFNYSVGLFIEVQEMDSFLNPFFFNVLAGAESVFYKQGFELTICNVQQIDSPKEFLNRFIYNQRVDGVILPTSKMSEEIVAELEKMKFPYVMLGQPIHYHEGTWIDIDNTIGGENATAHLLEQGYEKIAFIGGSKEEMISRNRLQGYRNGLLQKGLVENLSWIQEVESTETGGYEAMKRLLESDSRPDAIIAVNNHVAYGALQAIRESGFRCPEDIGMVTFDNAPLAPYTSPPLSCLDINTFELGKIAGEMLLSHIKQPETPNQTVLLSPSLVVRDSTLGKQK